MAWTIASHKQTEEITYVSVLTALVQYSSMHEVKAGGKLNMSEI